LDPGLEAVWHALCFINRNIHAYTGKNRCAGAIAPYLRVWEKQDFTYRQVRLDLTESVCSHNWQALARFSSVKICNIRVNSPAR